MMEAGRLSVRWRKSSYSSPNGGDCLEVGEGMTHIVPVRDSKVPEGAALMFSSASWSAFISSARTGELGND